MKVVGFGGSEADLKKKIMHLEDEIRDLKQTVQSQTERIGGLNASVMTMSKQAASAFTGGEPIVETHEQIVADYKKAFSVYDMDDDGTITTKELGWAMRSLGQKLTEVELAETIKAVDADGSGTIDFDEFLVMMHQSGHHEAVTQMDEDGDGVGDNDGDGVRDGVEGTGGGATPTRPLRSSLQKRASSLPGVSAFQQSVSGVISAEQVAELKVVFSEFDKNGDGTITSTELGTVLHSMGELTTKTDIQGMISKVDVDGSGTIDFPEFLDMMKGIHYGEGERPLDSESKASPG